MRLSGASLTAVLALFAALRLVSSPVAAQQSAADCAEIKDDRQRLACFDQFYSGAAKAGAREPDTSSITEARPAKTDSDRARTRTPAGADREDGRGDRVTERARRDAERARSEAEQARREAAQARREAEQLRLEIARARSEAELERRERARRTAPESETPEERFGMEKKVLELGGEEMSNTALGQFDFWKKGQRVELENGQVWEITNSTNLFHKTRNPKVSIEKGLFSSFYMHIEGVSKSLKVRRIR